MNDELPEFTMSPMREATDALNELFLNLQESGFTERQAVYMLGVYLGNRNDSDDEED